MLTNSNIFLLYYCFLACFARFSSIFFNSCIFSCTSNEEICSFTKSAVWVKDSKRCWRSVRNSWETIAHFVFSGSNCSTNWAYSCSTQVTHWWRCFSNALVSNFSFTSSTNSLLKFKSHSKICWILSIHHFSITHCLNSWSFLKRAKNSPNKKAINHRFSRFIRGS